MAKKLPKGLIPGEASDESIVAASDIKAGYTRGHKEGDISRLQSAIHDFDEDTQYKVDDVVLYNKKIYRNDTPNTPGVQFNPSQWEELSGDPVAATDISEIVIDVDKDWDGKVIKNHGTPVDDKDVTTKEFVEGKTNNIPWSNVNKTGSKLSDIDTVEVPNPDGSDNYKPLIELDGEQIHDFISDKNIADDAGIEFSKIDVPNGSITNEKLETGDYPEITGIGSQTKDIDVGNHKVVNSKNPDNAKDLTNKEYVDKSKINILSKTNQKQSVYVTSTKNIILNGIGQRVDNTITFVGDRILVKDQDDKTQNGIYMINNGGVWERADDADTAEELESALVHTDNGDVNNGIDFICITQNIILGTTPIEFIDISTSNSLFIGDGLQKLDKTLSVKSNSTDNTITVNENGIKIADNSITDSKIKSDANIEISKLLKGPAGTIPKSTETGITWQPDTGKESLESLTDVTITDPKNNEVITKQGDEWINKAIPEQTDGLLQDYDGTKSYIAGTEALFAGALPQVALQAIPANTPYDPAHWASTSYKYTQFLGANNIMSNPQITGTAKSLADVTVEPSGMYVDNNELFICDQNEARIYILNWTTKKQLRSFALHANNQSPYGFTIAKGYVYCTDSVTQKIFAYDKITGKYSDSLSWDYSSVLNDVNNFIRDIAYAPDHDWFFTITETLNTCYVFRFGSATSFRNFNFTDTTTPAGSITLSHHDSPYAPYKITIVGKNSRDAQSYAYAGQRYLNYDFNIPFNFSGVFYHDGFYYTTNWSNHGIKAYPDGTGTLAEDINKSFTFKTLPNAQIVFADTSLVFADDYMKINNFTAKILSVVGDTVTIRTAHDFTSGEEVTVELLNQIAITQQMRGAIINTINYTDGKWHITFADIPVQYLHMASQYLEDQNNSENDIFVSRDNPTVLARQSRDIEKSLLKYQNKLYLATTFRETLPEFADDTNKFWLKLIAQPPFVLNAFGNIVENVGNGVDSKDASNLGQVVEISNKEALRHGVIPKYSESEYYPYGKHVAFEGIIQRANQDIHNNTPYDPTQWDMPSEYNQSGLTTENSLGLLGFSVSGQFNAQRNPTTLDVAFGTPTDIPQNKIFYIPEIGRYGFFNNRGTDSETYTLNVDRAVTVSLNKSLTQILNPYNIFMLKAALGGIITVDSNGKKNLTPCNILNPGVFSTTDKFLTGLDGWSAYDVPNRSDASSHGDVTINHTVDHGGSIYADLEPKGNSYYYYGGLQKTISKAPDDAWGDIQFEYRSVAIPQWNGVSDETATKLVARILNPADDSLIDEIILIEEDYMPDSGWRPKTILLGNYSQHNSLKVVIAYDDQRWLDVKFKVYLDNFKLELIHGTNAIAIPENIDANYHKRIVCKKQTPTQFSLVDFPADREYTDDYIHLADIHGITTPAIPGKFYPRIQKIEPYRDLLQHNRILILGSESYVVKQIPQATTSHSIWFSVLSGVPASDTAIYNIIPKERIIDSFNLDIKTNATTNNLTCSMEILNGGVKIWEFTGILIDQYNNSVILPVNRSFGSMDNIQIILKIQKPATTPTSDVIYSLRAIMRNVGI